MKDKDFNELCKSIKEAGVMLREMRDNTLEKPVQFLKGVGPAKAKAFASLGVKTVGDLMEHYPRDYIWAVHKRVNELEVGDYAVIQGTIHKKSPGTWVKGKAMYYLKDASSGMHFTCAWFGCDFVKALFHDGRKVTLWGRVTEFNDRLQMVNPKHSFHGLPTSVLRGSGIPVYPACKDLPSEAIAKITAELVKLNVYDINHNDMYTLEGRGMCTFTEAMRYIHHPPDKVTLKRARKRIAYEELHALCKRMKEKRSMAQRGSRAKTVSIGPMGHLQVQKKFPFKFTSDQAKAVMDITVDMGVREVRSGASMYRLLQGDVGCGKTAVAIYASLLVAKAKMQTVVMVPTKILAKQHFEAWKKYTSNVLLLTSDAFKVTKDELYSGGGCISGPDVIIATTSVLSDKIDFRNLGLLIVDEQHRFGVKQKDKLVEQYSPHQLYMTATPIPRAIALTAFGDLDVSTIREMPGGRGNVKTKLVFPQGVDKMWKKVGVDVKMRGRQVYDIYPRINGPGGLVEATQASRVFEGGRVFMHGDCKPDVIEAAIDLFKNGSAKVLMTTSMVEVGVHVPKANVMVIHEAHMFGLSQLHQLRGRIGRGSDNATCYLLADTDDPEALERLAFLEENNDGFEVAQKDLELRGPGELTGVRQHGMPELKLADLVTDYKLLLQAKEDVS